MDNDIKTTLIAIFGGIFTLIAKFGIALPKETTDAIIVILVASTVGALGYFTNKSNAPTK